MGADVGADWERTMSYDDGYGGTRESRILPDECGAVDAHRRHVSIDDLSRKLHDRVEQLKATEQIVRDAFFQARDLSMSIEFDHTERLALQLCVVRLAEQLDRYRSGEVRRLSEQPARMVVTNEQMDRVIEIVSGGRTG